MRFDVPMIRVLQRWLTVFLRSWRPSPASRGKRWSLQRLAVLLLFWPLLFAVQLINLIGLLLDELLFPGYRRTVVRQPLFVLGMPRSGTTFLHRLLAGDQSRFTTPSLWELLFAPSISQRFFWHGVARLDRLIGRPLGRLLHRVERFFLGGLDGVHKTGLAAPEEDYLALMPVMGCFLLVLPFPDPELWRLAFFDRDLSNRDKRVIMRFYYRFVQRHLYFHGSDRTFLSKNPSFTPMLESLKQSFPDGRFIGCFRNPSEALASQVNSMLIGARLFEGRVDTGYWRERLWQMLVFYCRHTLEELSSLPEDRCFLVTMEGLAPAPSQTVLSIYRRFGWTASHACIQALASEDDRARRYRSGHHYSNDRLGICRDRLARDFDFVYDYFSFSLPQE